MTTRADLSAALVTALGPLVAGRVYARQFPQTLNDAAPTWPAIKYIGVVTTPSIDIMGGGTEEAADHMIQVDVASDATQPETTHLALVRAVRVALSAIGPQWVWTDQRDLADDFELKVVTTSMDFVVHLSA